VKDRCPDPEKDPVFHRLRFPLPETTCSMWEIAYFVRSCSPRVTSPSDTGLLESHRWQTGVIECESASLNVGCLSSHSPSRHSRDLAQRMLRRTGGRLAAGSAEPQHQFSHHCRKRGLTNDKPELFCTRPRMMLCPSWVCRGHYASFSPVHSISF
jgi:hypothetical protein